MKQILQTKVHHPGVWHATGFNEQNVVSSGHALLDQTLSGGWQTQVVYEVASQQQYATLSLLQSTLQRLSQKREWIILLNPPRWALDMLTRMEPSISEHLLVVHGKAEFDTLWSTEQAMRQGSAACVLAWPDSLEQRDIKRLKLAARRTESLCFIFPMQPVESIQTSQLQLRAHQSQSEARLIELPDLHSTKAHQDSLH